MEKYFVICALLVAAFFSGMVFRGRNVDCDGSFGRDNGRVDTVWVRDTVRLTTFVPRSVETVRIDTIRVHDTVRVALPIERKIYLTGDYRAVVEGFRPALTGLDIYRSTPVVTASPRGSRWSVGLQAGYGFSRGGPSPYIGAGVQYRLLEL